MSLHEKTSFELFCLTFNMLRYIETSISLVSFQNNSLYYFYLLVQSMLYIITNVIFFSVGIIIDWFFIHGIPADHGPLT